MTGYIENKIQQLMQPIQIGEEFYLRRGYNICDEELASDMMMLPRNSIN
jgi:hypothetical protein